LEFVENPVALKNIDNDIYKIVQIDEDIELWIKAHPRYEKNVLPIHSRVRFFLMILIQTYFYKMPILQCRHYQELYFNGL